MEELKNRQQIIEKIEDNVFVEAGAGAGKTTLIVSRIINQLKQGWEPGSIVVITFTNAAAEELRSRIIQRVKDASKEDDVLKEALLKLDAMNISTIHSFCFKLLQERIFDAKLPMDARLLEEEEAYAYKERFFTQWVGRLSTTQWQQLLQYGYEKYAVLQRMKSIFMSICELPDNANIYYDASVINPKLLQEAENWLDKCKSQFVQEAARVSSCPIIDVAQVSDDKLVAAGKELKRIFKETKSNDCLKLLKEVVTNAKWDAKKPENNIKGIFALPKKKTEADLKLIAEIANKDYRFWIEKNLKPWLESCEDLFHIELLQTAIEGRKVYRAQRPLYHLTNDDLLQKTERLLRESEEARQYFADKYRCIYVDEFQDTDWIQEQFIWRLAAMREDVDKLRDGALFVVGDPKQSIYRFRGAQPEVYFAVKKKMDALNNASVYCLDYNFRSNEKIIEWVNNSFENRAICEEKYRPMVVQKTLPQEKISKLMAGVYYYNEPDGLTTDIDKDVVALSQLIWKLKNQGYLITDYNQDGTPLVREILYSDFLVLCNTKHNMELYQQAMINIGIPVVMNGEIIPGAHRALKCFVRLFDYLIHPYDRAKALGALETLYERGPKRAKMLRQYLREATRGMSVYAVALYLKERIDVLLPEATDISEAEMLSLQTKLEQMVEHVLAEESGDSRVISERFWAYLDRKQKQELPLEEGAEAVRFMNLHKAKGLEGNIVILTKRDEALGFRAGNYRKGDDYYPCATAEMNGFKKTVWVSYSNRQDIMAEAEVAELQEQRRLEYVAATRPKQALIVMDGMKEWCMFTGYGIRDLGKNHSVKDIIEKGQPAQMAKQNVTDFEVGEMQQAGEEQKVAVYYSSKPSSLERHSAIRAQARKRHNEMHPNEIVKRPKGKDWGKVMHRSLELLIERWRTDFERKPEDLVQIMQVSMHQSLAEYMQEIGEENVQLQQAFLEKVLSCFVQWIYEKKLLREAKQVYTEFPFSFYGEQIPGMEEGATWMNGTADLIIEKPNGDFLILDYKSDSDFYMTEEEFAISLKEIYSGQLAMYRHAVGRLFGVEESKVHCGIVSFAGVEEIEVRYTQL